MAFASGDVATARQALKWEIDLTKGGTFIPICPTGMDEEMNVESEEWDDICTPTTNTATTAVKPTWSATSIIKKGTAEYDLCLKRFDVTAMTNIPFKKTDNFLDEIVEGFVSVTSLKIVYQAKELIKVEFEFATIGEVKQTSPIPVTP